MKIKSKFYNPLIRTKLLGTMLAACLMVVLVSCQNEDVTDENTAEVGEDVLGEEDFANKDYWKLYEPDEGKYILKNVKSHKYLSSYGTAKGENIRQLDWDKGQITFTFDRIFSESSDNSRYYRIRSKLNSNRVLDVAGFKIGNGGNIHLWDNNNTANQHWIFERYGDLDIVRIKNDTYLTNSTPSNKYISVLGSSKSSGANVITWQKNSNRDQYWYFARVD